RHTSFSRDWSSDVCSSDLLGTGPSLLLGHELRPVLLWPAISHDRTEYFICADVPSVAGIHRLRIPRKTLRCAHPSIHRIPIPYRSEERRVGKECICRRSPV